MTRRLRLATGVLGRILVKRCLAHLVAEIIGLALVLCPVFRRLLIHFHSTNRIFRQVSTSYRVHAPICVLVSKQVFKIFRLTPIANAKSANARDATRRYQPCLSTCLTYCLEISSGVKPVSSLILGRISRQSSPVAFSLRSKSLFGKFLTVKASLIRFL